jgi:hypothetical protein
MSVEFLIFNEMKNSAIPIIFSCHFRVLLFEYFSDRVVGTCQTCYRYCCSSLLTVFQLSLGLPPQTLSIRSPSNDHLIQSDIDVRTSSIGNSDQSEEKICIFSYPNNLPNSLLKYCTIAL